MAPRSTPAAGGHRVPEKIPPAARLDPSSRIDRRRVGSQCISRDRLPADAGVARIDHLRVRRQSVRIVGRRQPVVHVVVVNIVGAFARTRRTHIRPIPIARHAVRESRRAFDIEDIVIEVSIRSPSRPIGVENHIHVLPFRNVDGVVIDECVLHRTRELNPPMMIVLADVVANNRAGIPHANLRTLGSFVANQQKSALVVVAVVVLDDRIPAVPVGIEAFRIVLAASAIDFVELAPPCCRRSTARCPRCSLASAGWHSRRHCTRPSRRPWQRSQFRHRQYRRVRCSGSPRPGSDTTLIAPNAWTNQKYRCGQRGGYDCPRYADPQSGSASCPRRSDK